MKGFLDLYLESVFKKILLIKLYFERKMISQMKLNSEYLLELPAPEINAIWRMQYFFGYCLNSMQIQ